MNIFKVREHLRKATCLCNKTKWPSKDLLVRSIPYLVDPMLGGRGDMKLARAVC